MIVKRSMESEDWPQDKENELIIDNVVSECDSLKNTEYKYNHA